MHREEYIGTSPNSRDAILNDYQFSHFYIQDIVAVVCRKPRDMVIKRIILQSQNILFLHEQKGTKLVLKSLLNVTSKSN